VSEPPEHGERRDLLKAVRLRGERRRRSEREGQVPLTRYLGQVGVLGWTIVLPALIGLFVGRWLDRRFASGIFWSAPLMLLGLALGCWSAWKWMRRP
jgi:ATP synthase protein I